MVFVFFVQPSSLFDEKLHSFNLFVFVSTSQVEWCFILDGQRVKLCSTFDQQLDDMNVPEFRSQMEGSSSPLVNGFQMGSSFDQIFCHVVVSFLRSSMKWSAAIVVFGINIGSIFDEALHVD